ncbi:MAG: ArnT family glycosyltransferase [Acidobacteriota bacterium]
MTREVPPEDRPPFWLRRALAPHRPLAALAMLSLLIYLPCVWTRDLWNPDEPRYAEVTREMASRGDFILPHLNGEVYSQKPPVLFWLGGLAGRLPLVPPGSGPRLVAVIAAVFTLLLTFWIGRRLADAETGWLAGLVLLTSPLFFLHATSGVTDGLLAFWITLAIWCGTVAREKRSTTLWIACYLAIGLAVITKGPVGFIIPAGVLMIVAWGEDGIRRVRATHALWGLGIVLAVVAVWIVPASLRGGGEYLDTILLKQNIGRAYESWHHKEPFYYHLKTFPGGFVSWVLFLPTALYGAYRRLRRRAGKGLLRLKAARVSLVWMVFTFLFFSLVSGKKTRYLLPLYPAASLLVAMELRPLLKGARGRIRRGIPLVLACVLYVAVGAALLAIGFGAGGPVVSAMRDLAPDQREALMGIARWPGSVLFALTGGAVLGLSAGGAISSRGRPRTALACLLCTAIALAATTEWIGVPVLNRIKSARPLAEVVAAAVGGGREGRGHDLVMYRGDFAGVFNFYLRRDRIPVIRDLEEMLAFLSARPEAVVITREKDLVRLERRVEGLERLQCRRVGNEVFCAARVKAAGPAARPEAAAARVRPPARAGSGRAGPLHGAADGPPVGFGQLRVEG